MCSGHVTDHDGARLNHILGNWMCATSLQYVQYHSIAQIVLWSNLFGYDSRFMLNMGVDTLDTCRDNGNE